MLTTLCWTNAKASVNFKKARVVNNPIYANRSFCVFLEGQNYAATAYLVGGCLAVGVIAGAVAASA